MGLQSTFNDSPPKLPNTRARKKLMESHPSNSITSSRARLDQLVAESDIPHPSPKLPKNTPFRLANAADTASDSEFSSSSSVGSSTASLYNTPRNSPPVAPKDKPTPPEGPPLQLPRYKLRPLPQRVSQIPRPDPQGPVGAIPRRRILDRVRRFLLPPDSPSSTLNAPMQLRVMPPSMQPQVLQPQFTPGAIPGRMGVPPFVNQRSPPMNLPRPPRVQFQQNIPPILDASPYSPGLRNLFLTPEQVAGLPPWPRASGGAPAPGASPNLRGRGQGRSRFIPSPTLPPPPRRSTRQNRGVPPPRYGFDAQ